jgi:hypothetical protein
MKEYLLYQAYGNIEIINECKYALLRLIKVYSQQLYAPPEVIIYTDKPAEFEMFAGKLPITLQQISKEDVSRWRGSINFVHRVKIEIIKKCLRDFPGKVIYADTDTCCLQPLTDVFKSITFHTVFFHQYEGTIDSDQPFRKWKKFFKTVAIPEVEHPSPLHIQMCNAGIIGLEQSHLPLLDEVLALTDKLYQQFPKHIVEQFSFCYTFQKHNITILDSTSFFFHYWNLKEFRQLLQRFFTKYNHESIEYLMEKSSRNSPEKILADKSTFVQNTFLRKLAAHISRSSWKIGKYEI